MVLVVPGFLVLYIVFLLCSCLVCCHLFLFDLLIWTQVWTLVTKPAPESWTVFWKHNSYVSIHPHWTEYFPFVGWLYIFYFESSNPPLSKQTLGCFIYHYSGCLLCFFCSQKKISPVFFYPISTSKMFVWISRTHRTSLVLNNPVPVKTY